MSLLFLKAFGVRRRQFRFLTSLTSGLSIFKFDVLLRASWLMTTSVHQIDNSASQVCLRVASWVMLMCQLSIGFPSLKGTRGWSRKKFMSRWKYASLKVIGEAWNYERVPCSALEVLVSGTLIDTCCPRTTLNCSSSLMFYREPDPKSRT
jgi:hypothetical protein